MKLANFYDSAFRHIERKKLSGNRLRFDLSKKAALKLRGWGSSLTPAVKVFPS